MNWKKSLLVVAVVGMTAFTLVGCGKTEQTTSTPEQTASAAGQPAPATGQVAPTTGQVAPTLGSTRLAPPEGVAPGEKPPAPPAMDLATPAGKLGVSEQQLREALGTQTQGPPDFSTAAKQLGVSEQVLREALGLPQGAPPAGGPPQPDTGTAGRG